MSAWWETRSERERLLLGIMFVLLGFVFVWLIVVRPLADLLDSAKQRHGEAVVALAEARARLPSAAGPAAAGPADAIVARTAAEAGFTGARIARQGPAGVSVVLDAARPQALFGWIAEMERRGLVVERLRARANADRTLSAEIGLSTDPRARAR